MGNSGRVLSSEFNSRDASEAIKMPTVRQCSHQLSATKYCAIRAFFPMGYHAISCRRQRENARCYDSF